LYVYFIEIIKDFTAKKDTWSTSWRGTCLHLSCTKRPFTCQKKKNVNQMSVDCVQQVL